MGMSNMYAEYRAGRRTTPPATPPFGRRRGTSDADPRVRLSFNPTGFLQNFGNPFRRRSKPKHDSRRSHPIITGTMTKREFIELASFGVVSEFDPAERGVGHNFQAAQLKNPTWCDLCGDFIWGVYKSKQCLRCRNCHYTCHTVCRDLVTLDCKTDIDTTELTEVVMEEKKPSTPSRNEQDDGVSFSGFIRVHLNLSRPINVVSGSRPPSIYDVLKEGEESERKTLTSFYLPRDTVKALHVTSEFTAREVISTLLKKFKVADNPHKYALYERYIDKEDGRVRLRRIQDGGKPLVLTLQWSTDEKQLVLQENETGDIVWDDFTFPELNNFLRILDREEDEYIKQVQTKYKILHEKIQKAIEQHLIEQNSIKKSESQSAT
ncbi:ras association domain-containing protein 1-like isoform X2 [Tachypleus tridentatus]|uniref:ras association domain-containing protein 1-like isoform X2 n=1 Tax=Tachypleus tridentatus TaxID=6853 RepID=UPI003FCF9B3A